MGTIEGAAVALVMERGHPSVWSLKFDMRLLCAVYAVSPFNLTILNMTKKKHVKCNMHCMEYNINTIMRKMTLPSGNFIPTFVGVGKIHFLI